MIARLRFAAAEKLRQPALALLALMAVVGLVGLQRGSAPTPSAFPVLTLERAVSVASGSPLFPATLRADKVTLPDDWAQSRPGYSGGVWYRAGLRLAGEAVPEELLAIYVERACSSLQVRLNGYLISSGGRSIESSSTSCSRPQLVTLPPALLARGDNTIDFRVQGHALNRVASVESAGGLSRIEFGLQTTLAAHHAGRLFWADKWLEASAAVLIGLGCIMLAVGWLNPKEVYFTYFGWLCLGWVLHSLGSRASDLPWRYEVTEFLLSSSWAVLLAIAVQFFLSFAGLRSRTIEFLIAMQWFAMPLTLLLAGRGNLFVLANIWQYLLAIELFAVMGIYLVVTWRQRPQDFGPMALVVAAATIALGVELAAQQRLFTPAGFPIGQVVVPPLMLGVGARLFLLFAQALHRTQADRDHLAQQLQHLTQQLEARVEQTTVQRVDQFIERERKRIASDLHDDLGAKLLTIVHTTDTSSIPDLARDALAEMRLAVRGLAGKPVLLGEAMADWRAEIVSRLQQADIEVQWEDLSSSAEQVVPARVFTQLTRVLREAVNNVIKHSAATSCTVRCELDGRILKMRVRDNGRGIAADLHRSQGMSSMKRRAKQMNGQCLVASRPGRGVAVSITVPLE